MTGFDGLLEAHKSNLRARLAGSGGFDQAPGEGLARQEMTTGEWWLHLLGKPEEATVRAIKGQNPFSSTNYATQQSFATSLEEAGFDPLVAGIVGIAAGIANPLDPLNKIGLGELTKLGKAGKAVRSIGGASKLVKGSDELLRLDKAGILKALEKTKAAIDSGKLEAGNLKAATSQLASHEQTLTNIDELNNVLVAAQKRGVNVEDLSLAGSTLDQIRKGQRALLGMQSPTSLAHLRLFGLGKGELDDATVVKLLPRKLEEALVAGTVGLKDKIGAPIANTVKSVLEKMGVVDSDNTKLVSSIFKAVFKEHQGNTEQLTTHLEGLIHWLQDNGLNPNQLTEVAQAMEFTAPAEKQMLLSSIDAAATSHEKAPFETAKLPTVLSDAQKDILKLSGVSDEDVPIAISHYRDSKAPALSVGKDGRHRAKLVGPYVVVSAGSTKAAEGAIDELDKVFGQQIWKRHTVKDEGTYLVAKRLPFSKPIQTTFDFASEHLKNLEVVAAQLARKKQAIVGIHASDLLVADNGGVQIINPDVIQDAKSVKDALANSDIALSALASDMHIAPTELTSLKSARAARSVPSGVEGMYFRVGLGGDNVAQSSRLLMSSTNSLPWQNYIRAAYGDEQARSAIKEFGDFESLNGIEKLRKEYRDAIAKGESPYIEPIQLYRDDKGSWQIRDGHNRLTAAILEGIDAVPIQRLEMYEGSSKLAQDYWIGSGRRLSSVWRNSKLPRAISDNITGPFARNYSLTDVSGSSLSISASDIVKNIDPSMAPNVSKILTLGAEFTNKKVRSTRLEAATRILQNNFGGMESAYTAIAVLAEQAKDAKDFLGKLEGLLVDKASKTSIKLGNIAYHPELEQVFGRLKHSATLTLDALARDGILTEGFNLNRARIATDKGGVLSVFDSKANALTFVSNTDSAKSVTNYASTFLKNHGPVEEVEPLATINIVGSDTAQTKVVKDFYENPHPMFKKESVEFAPFKLSDELGRALKSSGVVIYNGNNLAAVTAELEKRGFTSGILIGKGRGATEGKILRPEYSFFVTKSGDIAIGLKQDNVSDLLKTVFGEGQAQFEEFGILSAGKIIINNPVGSLVRRIGKAELEATANRLSLLARRFSDMGLSDSTIVKVHTPLDDAIWRQMYGERTTIKDLKSPDFSLTIPDDLLGHAPDSTIDAPSRFLDADLDKAQATVSVTRTRLSDPNLQKLFKYLEDTKDELFVNEAKRGIPVAYTEGYLSRNMTKAARDALNQAYLDYPRRNSKSFKNLETALQGRVLTDLTTTEINRSIKLIQGSGGKDADQIISDVVASMRDGYVLKPSKETAANLVALSEILPNGLDFFYTNPVYSTFLRVKQHESAMVRQDIVQSLKDHGLAVWSGTVSDLRKARIGQDVDMQKLGKEIAELKDRRVALRNSYNEIVKGSPDVKTKQLEDIEKELDTVTTDLADKLSSRVGLIQKLGKGKEPEMLVDLADEFAWIKGEEASRLLSSGLIKSEDLIGDASGTLVRIPIKKYESVLDPDNAEVFLFPREVAKVVDRYFGTTTKDGFTQFLKYWDEIHAAWRAWTLFPIPSYHVRNGISSAFMAWLGGVTDPSVYRASFKIHQLITSFRKGVISKEEVMQAMKSMQFSNAAGKVTTAEELWGEFVRQGGLHGGRARNEFTRFGNIRRQSEFEALADKAGLRPSNELVGSWIFDNSVIRRGVSAAAWVENRFRFAAFIDAWRKAHVEKNGAEFLTGFDAAMMHVKKVFYDYSDMSAFEKAWLQRLIPFYAWSRHNVPRMIATLFTQPITHYRLGKFATDLERGVNDGAPLDDNELPEWVRNKYGIVISKTPKGSFLVHTSDGIFPMTDAYRILSGNGIVDMFKEGLTPFVKLPIEQLFNYNSYTNKEIERYPGERSSSLSLGTLGFTKRARVTEGPLSVLNVLLNEQVFRTMARSGSEVSRLVDTLFDNRNLAQDKPGVVAAITGLFLGRFYSVDPVKTKAAIYKNYANVFNGYKQLRQAAVRDGDTKAVEDIDTQLTWLRMHKPEESER